jgi:hypothetical protein
MDDSQCLKSIRLFLAAVWQLRCDSKLGRMAEAVPYDVRAFARAVDSERDKGNAYAERFLILGSIAGRTCPDFHRGMDLARMAGLMYRGEGGFVIDMTRRTVVACQRDPDRLQTLDVAKAYLLEAENN